MKSLKLQTLIAIIALSAFAGRAQNLADGAGLLVNTIVDSPWTVDTGYGRSVTGMGYNIGYVALADQFVTTTNASGTIGLSSGVVLGYEALWTSHQSQFNSLNGGFSVSYSGMPLNWVGTSWASNVCVSVSGYQLIATAKGGSAVGAITGGSVMATVYKFSPTLKLKLGGKYESRNGEGKWDGNDLLGSLQLSKTF